MSSSDNLAEVTRSIEEMISGINLLNDRLGHELFDVVSRGIAGRSAVQQAPDGSRWAPNAPEYAEAKGYLPVGVRTGLMLGPDQLRGERTVMLEEAEMDYGTGEEAREHAGFFAPRRPFWDFGGSDVEDMTGVVERFLEQHLARLNAK